MARRGNRDSQYLAEEAVEDRKTVAITRSNLLSEDLRDAAARTWDAKAGRPMLAIGLVLDRWLREAAAEVFAMDHVESDEID